ncbi:MAG: hypothetical protein SFU20_05555 [Chitinophagaceae bacterium]|nr:hypothetical protein [Chitinophagaceae bacterium]
MKKRTILFSFIGLLVAAGALYGYLVYTKGNKDLANVKPALTIEAEKLVQEFTSNEKAANQKYLPKEEYIIDVTGTVKSINKDERGKTTLVLQASASDMSSVQCAIDSTHVKDLTVLSTGASARVRGVVTGFNSDELLGSDVFLARCVLIQQ